MVDTMWLELKCNEIVFRIEFEKSSDGDETDTICFLGVQGPCGRRAAPSGLVWHWPGEFFCVQTH